MRFCLLCQGKEEVPVCSLSGFDVYLVDSTKVKAPKAHSFAIRSQNKITMFEKPEEDYVHYFSLSDPAAHRDWVRAIMNARTYVLRQEYAALFRPPAPTPGTAAAIAAAAGTPTSEAGESMMSRGGASLSRRSTTRRTKPASGPEPQVPAPPAPLIGRDAFAGPFEKGSLLAEVAMKNVVEHPGSGLGLAGPSQGDYSVHDRTRARVDEAAKRAEMMERARKARAEGQPLVDLVGSR